MNAKNELAWKQIFNQSTPKEREEITILMVAYLEKKKELTEDPFPFTSKTWGEFPWLLRKRLLAYTIFMNVKQKLKGSLPKHITLFNNLILLIVGAFEHFRFEYQRYKKIRDTVHKKLKPKKINAATKRKLQCLDGAVTNRRRA